MLSCLASKLVDLLVHRTIQDARFDQVAESHQDYFQYVPPLHVPLDLCDPYKPAVTV
jgi:hypothetical protein